MSKLGAVSARRELLPANSVDLIDKLAALNPPRCKFESETLEQHARYAGKCELIAYLIRLRDDTAATDQNILR